MFRWNNNLATWIALFSVLFLAIGIIISRKLFKKEVIHVREIIVEAPAPVEIDHKQADRIGLSKREYEVLKLIHDGLSNQQIGEKFCSETRLKNTSQVFWKVLKGEMKHWKKQTLRYLTLMWNHDRYIGCIR